MNERRFHGDIERLRSTERLSLLETERVVGRRCQPVPIEMGL